jgi:hypothetical protein
METRSPISTTRTDTRKYQSQNNSCAGSPRAVRVPHFVARGRSICRSVLVVRLYPPLEKPSTSASSFRACVAVGRRWRCGGEAWLGSAASTMAFTLQRDRSEDTDLVGSWSGRSPPGSVDHRGTSLRGRPQYPPPRTDRHDTVRSAQLESAPGLATTHIADLTGERRGVHHALGPASGCRHRVHDVGGSMRMTGSSTVFR